MEIAHIICKNGCYVKKIPHQMDRYFAGVWKWALWTKGLRSDTTNMLYTVVINFLGGYLCVVVVLSCYAFVSI